MKQEDWEGGRSRLKDGERKGGREERKRRMEGERAG